MKDSIIRNFDNSASHVLVTGVAGFIASRTAQLLLDRGVQVVGLDNLNDYYDPALKHHRLALLKHHPGFQFVHGDIEHLDELRPLFARYQFSTVFNLAARAGVRYSMENPHVYLATNALGTLNLLELMREHGISQMVLASTSSRPASKVSSNPGQAQYVGWAPTGWSWTSNAWCGI